MFLKKQPNKKPPIGELYYPRPVTSIFQNSPSFNFFFFTCILYCGQSNFEFEYLGVFVTEFENILRYESGAQVCSFDEKKRRSKISCSCPFKQSDQKKCVLYRINIFSSSRCTLRQCGHKHLDPKDKEAPKFKTPITLLHVNYVDT